MIDYSYLAPPKKVYHIKLPLNYIYDGTDGINHRRIFKRSNYEKFEWEAIQKLKEYLHLRAPNISYPDELLLRFNYAGHFLFPEVTEKVKVYDEWHQNQLIVNLNQFGRDILENGHFYAFGRDYEYCPIIIVKPSKINIKKYQISNYLNAIANLLDPLEKYMLIGGVIEKWSVLIDFQQKKHGGVLGSFESILKRVMQAYPCRMKRIYFVNVHSSCQAIISKISELVKSHDDEIYLEIIKDFDDLSKYISTDQRQIKYGGYLSNICEFWPIHTTNKFEQTEVEISNTEYESVANDPIYFQDPKAPFCEFYNTKCDIY